MPYQRILVFVLLFACIHLSLTRRTTSYNEVPEELEEEIPSVGINNEQRGDQQLLQEIQTNAILQQPSVILLGINDGRSRNRNGGGGGRGRRRGWRRNKATTTTTTMEPILIPADLAIAMAPDNTNTMVLGIQGSQQQQEPLGLGLGSRSTTPRDMPLLAAFSRTARGSQSHHHHHQEQHQDDLQDQTTLPNQQQQQQQESVVVLPENKRPWLQFELIPPTKISAKLHSEVVLECEAVGSPPPVIYWLKNGQPLSHLASIDSAELLNGLDTKESLLARRSSSSSSQSQSQSQSGWNLIPSDFAMVKIKSKLPLRCIRPEEEANYSCVADNFRNQLVTTTAVDIEEDDTSMEWKPECEFRIPTFFYNKKGYRKGTGAYIHLTEPLHMETMGKDIILPCRAGGKPSPIISWTGNDGQMIIPDKKFMLNTNGDLVINNLSWEDMGEYTCLAQNAFGYEAASTFVYPLLSDDEEEARVKVEESQSPQEQQATTTGKQEEVEVEI